MVLNIIVKHKRQKGKLYLILRLIAEFLQCPEQSVRSPLCRTSFRQIDLSYMKMCSPIFHPLGKVGKLKLFHHELELFMNEALMNT